MTKLFFFYLCLIFVSSAHAEFRFLMNTDVYHQNRSLFLGALDPQNKFLRRPTKQGVLDIKPEFMVRSETADFVFRPRWTMNEYTWEQGEYRKGERSAQGEGDITDLFLKMNFNDQWRAIVGLEVYQWGPSELMNVSNPVYHLNSNARNSFYKEKGEVLTRVSWDASPNLNIMAIGTPMSNGERLWRADDQFEPFGFLKAEYTNNDGSFYVGTVGGMEADNLPFVGEYVNWSHESGWSVYAEARHTMGDRSFYPYTHSTGFIELINDTENKTLVHKSLFGIRWEGGFDARTEFFFNSSGYNSDDFKKMLTSVGTLTPFLEKNFSRALQPGLELYGKAYNYTSLRIPNAWPSGNLTIFVRNLLSLQDGSGSASLSFDQPFKDSFTFIIEGSSVYGGKDKELTLIEEYNASVGFRWTL